SSSGLGAGGRCGSLGASGGGSGLRASGGGSATSSGSRAGFAFGGLDLDGLGGLDLAVGHLRQSVHALLVVPLPVLGELGQALGAREDVAVTNQRVGALERSI